MIKSEYNKLPLEITIRGHWQTKQVRINDKLITPDDSQKVRNHSLDGFNWGYGGTTGIGNSHGIHER